MTLYFTELSAEEYAQFESQHILGTYTQSIEQYNLLIKRNHTPYLLGVKDDNVIVAASLVMTEMTRLGSVFLFDRGPLIDFSNTVLLSFFIREVRKFARKHGVLYMQWEPNITYAKTDDKGNLIENSNDAFLAAMKLHGLEHQPFEFGMSTTGSPSWEYVKNLSDLNDLTDIRKSYGKNVQYYLKKNQQFGIKLRQLSREDLPEFKNLTQKTADRLHYHDKDLSFYELLYDTYGDNAKFVFAELNFETYITSENQKIDALNQKLLNIQNKINKYPNQEKFKRQFNEFDDQKQHHIKRVNSAEEQMAAAGKKVVVVAGALFIQQPQEMTYLYSGTYEMYKDYYGPYQIQDTMIQQAVSSGIKSYNFYGISGRFDGSDGVLGFKTAFEGEARQLVGSFILPIQPVKYKVYRLLKKVIGRK